MRFWALANCFRHVRGRNVAVVVAANAVVVVVVVVVVGKMASECIAARGRRIIDALDGCGALLNKVGRSCERGALEIGVGDGLGYFCRFIIVAVVGFWCPECTVARRRGRGKALHDLGSPWIDIGSA